MKHYLTKLQETTLACWDRPSLCDWRGDTYTYGQVAAEVERFHLAFHAAGLRKGDKVAICARNSACWAISFWAVNTYEAVAVPIRTDFRPEGIMRLVNHSDSVLLFTDADIFEKLDIAKMPALRAVINNQDYTLLASPDEAVGKAYEQRNKLFSETYPEGFRRENVHYPTGNEADVAIINYTSGTTSEPKGVMLTYGALCDTDEYSNTHFPNTHEDTMISMLPMAHMYGLAIEFIHPNVDGVPIYYLGKTPSPSTLLGAMKDVKPYMVVTVPLVMEKVYESSIKPAQEKVKWALRIPGVKQLVYKKVRDGVNNAFGGKVRCYIMGGAPLKPEVERCFKAIRLPYMVGYGMTEACPLLGWEWWEDFVPGSCGKAVHEVRIDSEDPAHVPGEIQARGANLTIGYYKNPEATAAAFTEDGWFRTGDMGIVDEAGNIFIRGRIKSMILSASGQNIYPEEVEAVLLSHPLVAEAIVVGRESKVVGLVYLDENAAREYPNRGLLAGQIRVDVNKQLPIYSQIALIELMDKPFEKTPKMSIKRYLYK